MKTRTITLIVLAVGALIGVLLWRADVACSVPRHRNALRIGEAAGCIEFWLNRYQSVWSGLLATAGVVLAALLAWRGVSGQMAHQAKANRISELTFWQNRFDMGLTALTNANLALRACRIVKEELERGGSSPFPNIAIAERLHMRGEFPLRHINPDGIDDAALLFRHAAELANRHEYRGGNSALLQRSNEVLGARFADIAALIPQFEQRIPEINDDVQHSGAMITRLEWQEDQQALIDYSARLAARGAHDIEP